MMKKIDLKTVLSVVLLAAPLAAIVGNRNVIDKLLALDIISGHAFRLSLIGIAIALSAYLLYQWIYASDQQRPFVKISLLSLLGTVLSFLFLAAGPVLLMERFSLIPLSTPAAICICLSTLMFTALQIGLDIGTYQARRTDEINKVTAEKGSGITPWLLTATTMIALLLSATVLLIPDASALALIVLTYTIWNLIITLTARPQIIIALAR